MKKKVLDCSIIIIALCLFGLVFLRFSSTNDNLGNDGIQYMLTAENLASGESRATFLYFEEESIIYHISQNGIPNYYRYYFERQENVLLGSIPDCYIGRDEVARLMKGSHCERYLLMETKCLLTTYYLQHNS